MQQRLSRAEYLWLDGNPQTQHIRSKTRIIPYMENRQINIYAIPYLVGRLVALYYNFLDIEKNRDGIINTHIRVHVLWNLILNVHPPR